MLGVLEQKMLSMIRRAREGSFRNISEDNGICLSANSPTLELQETV